MRRCSTRALWTAAGAAVTGEPSRDMAVAIGPQQGEVATVAVATP
jgi:hypothetical protein